MHVIGAIIGTLETLHTLKGIEKFQNSEFRSIYKRARARMWVPASIGDPEKLLLRAPATWFIS